ncbi:MAG: stage 0 sporulation family protein, partial [Clostridia bacterium]|nr:stage 0 sporulation family protein [Clostridia bacterium]
VIGVKFHSNTKIYYFDPKDITFNDGDFVIVETSRGLEFGTVATGNHFVEEETIVKPLKEVIRKATDKDIKQNAENMEKKKWAYSVCLEKIQKRGLPMKLVDADYTFDRSKAIFSFTSEGRVDFRELVKDLALVIKSRIELRQIYERDDIKIRGALAPCGRVCCCHAHLADFEKVTIKMAKNQGLSLNPQKISGVCGKLMCCLKYENEYYVETLKEMPKVGATIITNDGEGLVDSVDLLNKTIKAKIQNEDGGIIINEYKLADIKSATQYNDISDDEDENNEQE